MKKITEANHDGKRVWVVDGIIFKSKVHALNYAGVTGPWKNAQDQIEREEARRSEDIITPLVTGMIVSEMFNSPTLDQSPSTDVGFTGGGGDTGGGGASGDY